MSTQEQKMDSLILENGDGIECPYCKRVIEGAHWKNSDIKE